MSYFIKQNAVNKNLHSIRWNKIAYIKHFIKNLHKIKIGQFLFEILEIND